MGRLWVVDLEVYSKLTATFSLLTFAANRFGFFLRPVFFRKFLNTHNVFFNQFTRLHDNYLQMAATVTGSDATSETPAMRKTDEINLPFILLNNTCSDLAVVRKMSAQQLTGICKWILEHTSYQVAFAGTKSDRHANAAIISELAGSRVINIAGQYDFESYYDFIQTQCAFVISIDSAPLHIALKLGVPTISIWGPTNPSFYLAIPAEQKNRHLFCYEKVACSPCVHHFDKLPCKGDNFCIKSISPETVISKIRQLLVELDFSQRIETDASVFV
jgi:ADP-heptose:LPS heptosyltransferase